MNNFDRLIIYILFSLVFIALIIHSSDKDAHGHGTHLSDIGQQHQISMQPCGNGTYAIESKERGCFLLYKDMDFINPGVLHVKPLDLDEDGDCACPQQQ